MSSMLVTSQVRSMSGGDSQQPGWGSGAGRVINIMICNVPCDIFWIIGKLIMKLTKNNVQQNARIKKGTFQLQKITTCAIKSVTTVYIQSYDLVN